MATYIVNAISKEVHISTNTTAHCYISSIKDNHRIDTDMDYAKVYPSRFNGCPYCYKEAAVKA
ncbi:hypothetical protein [Aneurinibacillus tyrosinisolvens]|uniref:hypothetical protein n=1 Tax=Aneurinibacillus tyrosinisolvens TaxID=1443435 RepID=UPI00063F9D0A|nr:hypothetical protein [Aneurinibacillus tyrosinisolvens]